MNLLVRPMALFALCAAAALANPAAADYGGPDGYGTSSTGEFNVSHDGYVREGEQNQAVDPNDYPVIEAESGETEEIDGQTVIVVQEPEPTAATESAPPPPPTVAVEQPVAACSNGIWVDGYWSYGNGDYVWVDGHCVVERVNYVFVQPRWDYYANLWWFVPGYYRPYGVYVGFGYYRPWQWYPPYYHPYYGSRYYGSRYPAPVYRPVPRRPTTVRATPAPRGSSHGVMPRPGYPRGRTTAVQGRPSTRTPGVYRAAPTRTPSVSRPPPTRTPSVYRAGPTRTPSVYRAATARAPMVTRTPITRAATVTRTSPSATAGHGVVRARPAATHASTASRTSAPRTFVSPSRTSSVRNSSVRQGASTAPARAWRPSAGVGIRPSAGGARSMGWGSPRSGASRGGGFSRPSGGFSRPSSGAFGGARSMSPARGR